MSGEVLYSKDHLWVSVSDNKAYIGITEYAQNKLGNIMFVTLPDEGEVIEAGEKFGDIESIKTVSDLISPISGNVIEINQDACDDPEIISESPNEAWLICVEDFSLASDLMTEDEYLRFKD